MVEAGSEALQGAPRVVRGEHRAARRKRRALLQMQVGDEQGVLGLPIEGAGRTGRKEWPASLMGGRLPAKTSDIKRSRSPIASAIRSSTASRNSASLASPGA